MTADTVAAERSRRKKDAVLVGCNMCSEPDPDAALMVCSRCSSVAYCCELHQREDWPDHKYGCKRTAKLFTEAGWSEVVQQREAARRWHVGLPEKEQHEWFINCYQMRLDDDCCWGGCNLHGVYAEGHTAGSVTKDFLVFCKLAQAHGLLPAGWNWDAFLTRAAGLLRFAFEKADAKDKYGSENFFNGMMGGRSLRFTAEAVYDSSCQGGGNSLEHDVMLDVVDLLDDEDLDGPEAEEILDGVGGSAAWHQLLSALEEQLPGAL